VSLSCCIAEQIRNYDLRHIADASESSQNLSSETLELKAMKNTSWAGN
jgi:hypothetical protein